MVLFYTAKERSIDHIRDWCRYYTWGRSGTTFRQLNSYVLVSFCIVVLPPYKDIFQQLTCTAKIITFSSKLSQNSPLAIFFYMLMQHISETFPYHVIAFGIFAVVSSRDTWTLLSNWRLWETVGDKTINVIVIGSKEDTPTLATNERCRS